MQKLFYGIIFCSK